MAGDVVNIALTTGKLGAIPASDARDDVLETAIARARCGDLDAFDIIIQRSERRVVSVAWRILGNEDDARDAAQEVFLRVFRYLGSFRDGENFSAWLYRIAINTCRDARRGRATRASRFPSMVEAADAVAVAPSQDALPDDTVLRAQRQALIQRALAGLADREREAFVLRDLQGLSNEEVAAVLGMRAVTVRSYVSTARAKVRSYCAAAIDECVRAGGAR